MSSTSGVDHWRRRAAESTGTRCRHAHDNRRGARPIDSRLVCRLRNGGGKGLRVHGMPCRHRRVRLLHAASYPRQRQLQPTSRRATAPSAWRATDSIVYGAQAGALNDTIPDLRFRHRRHLAGPVQSGVLSGAGRAFMTGGLTLS
jgi:hypothetical protein